ncbi:hypothetical protein ABM001_16810 [Morganella morganii]
MTAFGFIFVDIKMNTIFIILSVLFVLSLVISFLSRKTWYRVVARAYVLVFSTLLIGFFSYLTFGRGDVKCTNNVNSFYDDSGTLCYKKEIFHGVNDIDKNKEIKIIGFKIISDDEVVIDLEDGRKSVIIYRNGKFDFLSYEWHKIMREIEDEHREKHKK